VNHATEKTGRRQIIVHQCIWEDEQAIMLHIVALPKYLRSYGIEASLQMIG